MKSLVSIVGVVAIELTAAALLKFKSHYAVQRSLHIATPGLRRWVPVFGGKSLPELATLIVLAVTLVVAAFSAPKQVVGLLADSMSAIAIILGLRDSQIRFILRSEVVVFWHKVCAFLALLLLIVHCATVGRNYSGLLIAVSMLSVPFAFVAYRFGLIKYVWFHWYHAVTLVVFFAASSYHGTTAINILAGNYVIAYLKRYLFAAYYGTAQVVRVSNDVVYVEVTVPLNKPLGFAPGQHYAIDLPALDGRFSRYCAFSTIPVPRKQPANTDDDFQRVCFYMRQVGPWTARLYDLGVDSASRGGPDLAGAKQHYVKLEGPHGFVSVDYADADLYPTVLLVAEGVYVAPALSVLADLVDKRSTRQKVVFVWTVRDADLAVDVSQRILRPLLQHEQYDPSAAAAMVTTNVLHASSSSESPLMDDSGRDVDPAELDVSPSGLQLETRFFYSGDAASTAAEELRRAGWCRGRPCLSEIVRTAVEQTPASTATKRAERPRAAVVVCGPEALVEEVRDLCDHEVYVSRASGERVVVDCHEDCFDS